MTETIATQHYTSLQLVTDYLQGFGLDSILTSCKVNETLLTMVDSYIDTNTFRDFKLHNNRVEFHHGNGKDNINTMYFPIVRLSRMVMYNQLLQAMRVFLDTELIVYPDRGEIFLPPIYPAFLADKPFAAILGNIFIPGRYNIEIDYDYGYETPPVDIQTAATKLLAIDLLRGYGACMSGGANSRSIDGYSESFGKIPYEGLIAMWQKDVDTIIAFNRRVYARAV